MSGRACVGASATACPVPPLPRSSPLDRAYPGPLRVVRDTYQSHSPLLGCAAERGRRPPAAVMTQDMTDIISYSCIMA
jgi:hypothetical protein